MSRLGYLAVVCGGLIAVLLLVSSSVGLLGWGRGIGGYGWGIGPGMMGGFGFPMMGMMGFGMILFWVLVIGGVVWFAQSLGRSSGTGSTPSTESPLDILKRRYSLGEINKEQFEQMKRDLGL